MFKENKDKYASLEKSNKDLQSKLDDLSKPSSKPDELTSLQAELKKS